MSQTIAGYPFIAVKNVNIGWVLENVLTKNECDFIIKSSEQFLKPSTTISDGVDVETDHRTSMNCFMNYKNPISGKIAKYVQEIMLQADGVRVPFENFEDMQVVRYKTGDRYKEHNDFFDETEQEELKSGGQRIWSALVYLNNVSNGGGTEFLKLHKTIYPKRGRMVVWKNTIDGKTIDATEHQGLAPIGCEKWACNVWVREGDVNGTR